MFYVVCLTSGHEIEVCSDSSSEARNVIEEAILNLNETDAVRVVYPRDPSST